MKKDIVLVDKPLFRIPFTLYFICYERIDGRKYLCIGRKQFDINGYHYEKL